MQLGFFKPNKSYQKLFDAVMEAKGKQADFQKAVKEAAESIVFKGFKGKYYTVTYDGKTGMEIEYDGRVMKEPMILERMMHFGNIKPEDFDLCEKKEPNPMYTGIISLN
ncbi:MAG: hypothetical protein LUB83_00085 [Prevotellaceae bacterium]|nr:hypothetical protein [Prevotellaceae bacterium]